MGVPDLALGIQALTTACRAALSLRRSSTAGRHTLRVRDRKASSGPVATELFLHDDKSGSTGVGPRKGQPSGLHKAARGCPGASTRLLCFASHRPSNARDHLWTRGRQHLAFHSYTWKTSMEGPCEWSSHQLTPQVLSSWGIDNNLHDPPVSPLPAAFQPPRVALPPTVTPGRKGRLRGKPRCHRCASLRPRAETSRFPSRLASRGSQGVLIPDV